MLCRGTASQLKGLTSERLRCAPTIYIFTFHAIEFQDEIRTVSKRWCLESCFAVILQNSFHDFNSCQSSTDIGFRRDQFRDGAVAFIVRHFADHRSEPFLSLFLIGSWW